MAMGGSTNAVLHIPAIAREAGLDIDVAMFDNISRETPNICSIIPAGTHEMADIDQAGGIPAVLQRLQALIEDAPTVTGKSIKQIAETAEVLNDDAIRSPDDAYHAEGGIAVLTGNIAASAIIKQTAVEKEMLVHSGPAKVFYSEKDLLDAIEAKQLDEQLFFDLYTPREAASHTGKSRRRTQGAPGTLLTA